MGIVFSYFLLTTSKCWERPKQGFQCLRCKSRLKCKVHFASSNTGHFLGLWPAGHGYGYGGKNNSSVSKKTMMEISL